jgi:spore coat polysaccharide biosynthesis protein SpsF
MNPLINIITVVQARMGSSRLPGKVLVSLAGKPLIVRIVERIKRARLAGVVVVAATNQPEDDIIEDLCRAENIEIFRGHPKDLLDRHYRTGLKYNADAVVKIPSDCPLIDPNIIDRVLAYYVNHQNDYDFVSNLHPPTYPDGNDVEVMKMDSLKQAWLRASLDFEREHTTPYIWENPHLFRIGNVCWEADYNYSMTHRWTIDYEEDYIFIKTIYDELYHINPRFGIYDILNLLDRKPLLKNINNKYAGVNWYRNHLHQLKTITANQTKVI